MSRPTNSYEDILRTLLEARGVSLLAVDECEKATPEGRRIKNFDFIVWRESGPHWLLEVKGRKLGHSATPNAWVTLSDISSLEGWKAHFGKDFDPLICFVFELGIAPDSLNSDPKPTPNAPELAPNCKRGAHFHLESRSWQAWLIRLDDFQANARTRSKKWRTIMLSSETFHRLAIPLLSEI